MSDKAKEYIVSLLRNRAPLPEGIDAGTFRFLASGHIDSLGLIKFTAEIENEFDIEFTSEDYLRPEFQSVDGLAEIIEEKLKQ